MKVNFAVNFDTYFKDLKVIRVATSSSGDIEDDSLESKNESQIGFKPGSKGLEFNSPDPLEADIDVSLANIKPKPVIRHQSQAITKLQIESSIKKLKDKNNFTVRKRTSYILVSKHGIEQPSKTDTAGSKVSPIKKKENPGISQFVKMANCNGSLPEQNDDSDSESGSEGDKEQEDSN